MFFGYFTACVNLSISHTIYVDITVQVELLVRAHDCYTLGCSVDGISEVLLVVRQWVPNLILLKLFSLVVSVLLWTISNGCTIVMQAIASASCMAVTHDAALCFIMQHTVVSWHKLLEVKIAFSHSLNHTTHARVYVNIVTFLWSSVCLTAFKC